MSALVVRNLNVQLGGKPVLEDLNLSLEAGELLVLAGPSGSGKSTLLRAVAGLVPVQSGTLTLDGAALNTQPPGQRSISMMFQNYALFPHLSIFENLAFGLRARSTPRVETAERVRAVATTLGLESHLEKLPRELSGGERQRVALGRVMLRKPRLFLLDEPLSSLDAQLRVQARAEILRMQRDLGVAALYVTHDQSEALAIADRLGILREGRLEQIGKPLELYRQPRNLFVARFLGNPAMNILDAQAVHAQQLRIPGLPLEGTLSAPIPLHAGQMLVAGLRPEHVHIAGSRWAPPPSGPLLNAEVDTVEPVGDQQYLLLRCGSTTLTARAEPERELRRGERVQLHLETAHLHLFDAASGLSLRAHGE